MNVSKIDGSGGVDRHSQQAGKSGGSDASDHAVLIPAPRRDTATISDAGRDTLRRAEELTQQLRQHDPARADLVRDARARLESGELDTAEVYRAAAEALLRDSI